MNIDQKEFIIQVKFGLNHLVSMEPEIFVPTKIIGHVALYCNHVVSSVDENNSIKNVKQVFSIASKVMNIGFAREATFT